MKTYRSTFALVGLFFAGLLGLWWLEYSGVLTEAERRERLDHVLPDLMDTPETAINRVEIARGGQTLAFERRGKDRWQMTEPLDVAADPTAVERLVRNLKGLRRSPDTGSVSGAAETYGLAPPAAVVRLWTAQDGAAERPSGPRAVLEVGKAVHEFGYVRAAGARSIEVVSKKLVAFMDRPVTEWREQNLVPIASFQVTRLSVHRHDLDLKFERSPNGRWRLSAPVVFPGNAQKIESALGALSAIRVVDGAKGFVADNVKDFAPYGLAPADATIEVFSSDQPDAPLVLHVGKKPPDHPDRVYVRRGDQDDVVLVSDRFLPEIPKDSVALRAQDVTDILPAAVSQIEIKAQGSTFRLTRQRNGWALESPHAEKADLGLVQAFLRALDGLKTSEFLAPERVIRPDLDPPAWDVKVWQNRSNAESAISQSPAPGDAPALSLRIGRHDRLKKTVYGQVEGDSVILALPDSLVDVLPRNQYAFRDRSILSVSPSGVTKLKVALEGKTTVIEPDRTSSLPNRWRMLEPVKAPADTGAITQLMALLSDLRAEEYAGELTGDGKPFGLDHPPVVVSWESATPGADAGGPEAKAPAAASAPSSHAAGSLGIGNPVPGKPGAFYARVEGQPFVFTLPAAAVQVLTAELHDTQILSLAPDSIRRLVFHTSGRTLAFARVPQRSGSSIDWIPEPLTDASKVDLSRFNNLVVHLAQLRTTRFFQYDGPYPGVAGLARPGLELEFFTADGKSHVLRVGATMGAMVLAATGTGSSGPIFFLNAGPWNALIQTLTPAPEFPENVFAH